MTCPVSGLKSDRHSSFSWIQSASRLPPSLCVMSMKTAQIAQAHKVRHGIMSFLPLVKSMRTAEVLARRAGRLHLTTLLLWHPRQVLMEWHHYGRLQLFCGLGHASLPACWVDGCRKEQQRRAVLLLQQRSSPCKQCPPHQEAMPCTHILSFCTWAP